MIQLWQNLVDAWSVLVFHREPFSIHAFTIQNTWNHCALVRNSGTLTIYINGTSSGTPVSNSTNFSSSGTFIIGAGMHTNSPDPNAFITGYIQDFRITKGLARYTANFTPPTAELEG